jgi:hypothetical protein
MTNIEDITDDLKDWLSRRSAFSLAKIFRREERAGDEMPETCAVYLYPENPRPEETDFNLDLRIYPVNVLVKFQTHGHGILEQEDDRDVASNEAFAWMEEVIGMTKEYNIRLDNPTNCYAVQFKDSNLKFKAEDTIAKSDPPDTQRVLVVLDFHTSQRYDGL